jgi:hypothetical protein
MAAREWVEDEEADTVAVGAVMNVDDELGLELAAMADAWLGRQGAKGHDSTAQQGQAGGRAGSACPCDDSGVQLGQRRQELELRLAIHGCGRPWRAESEERGPMGSEGEREQRASTGVALDGRDVSPTHEGRARNVATMVGTRSCMEATSWTRAAHWGILPSMWRAVKRSAWDAILGWL